MEDAINFPLQWMSKLHRQFNGSIGVVGEKQQRNRWLAGMELELRVNEYGRIVPGETSEQNYGSQYFHQPDVLNQAFPDIPMNPDIHNTIPARTELEVYDQVGAKNTLFAGMPLPLPLEIGVHNNTMTSQKYYHPASGFPHVPLNPDIQHEIPAESEF